MIQDQAKHVAEQLVDLVYRQARIAIAGGFDTTETVAIICSATSAMTSSVGTLAIAVMPPDIRDAAFDSYVRLLTSEVAKNKAQTLSHVNSIWEAIRQ